MKQINKLEKFKNCNNKLQKMRQNKGDNMNSFNIRVSRQKMNYKNS